MPSAFGKCNPANSLASMGRCVSMAKALLLLAPCSIAGATAEHEPIEILYDETVSGGGSGQWLTWLLAGVSFLLVAIIVLQFTRHARQMRNARHQLEQATTRLREAQLIARIGSWSRDFDSGETFWSDEARRVLGLEGRQTQYKHYERLIHPDDVEKVTEVVAAAYCHGGEYLCDHRVICPDNSEKYIRLAGRVYVGDDMTPVRETGTVQDITHQHQAETAIQQSEQRLRTILDATPYPILIVENSDLLSVLYANRSTFELFDLDSHCHYEDIHLQQFWSEPAELTRFVTEAATMGVSGRQVLMRNVAGRHYWGELSGRLMDFSGVEALFVTLTDVTERRRMLADLERLATTDALTGVLNRRSFLETMQRELRRSIRYRQPFSQLMLDIDHFKRVNDHYGHAFGDEVLRRFCETVESCLREEDQLGRIGGEEFGVILVSSAQEGGYVVAERIRRRWQDEVFEIQGARCNFTVSIGVAQLQSDDESVEDIMERADRGLYGAKRAGRNCVIVFNGDNAADVKSQRQ